MARIFINNSEGLIGDFLGTIPVMQELSKGNDTVVNIHPAAEELFNLIPKSYGLRRGNLDKKFDKFYDLDSSHAFKFSDKRNLYMTDTYLAMHGFKIDINNPRKADLEIPVVKSIFPHSVDYVLAPYSRSLPEDQRWPLEKWHTLIERHPDKMFAVLGTDKQDNPYRWEGENSFAFFDMTWIGVANLMKASKGGLISVISGPSHFAFHLGVPNILLCNQDGRWGVNPDAILLKDKIPTITVEQVSSYLK